MGNCKKQDTTRLLPSRICCGISASCQSSRVCLQSTLRVPLDAMDHLRFLSWNSTGRSKDNALEDEQLMSKESGELETQLRILYERQSKLRRWIIGLSILVGILALALLGAVSHSTQDSGGEQTVLSPVPRMPRTKVTFEEDKLFANGSNPKSDEAWATLTPQGDGFIPLANNTRQQWELEPGKPTKAGEVLRHFRFPRVALSPAYTHTYIHPSSFDWGGRPAEDLRPLAEANRRPCVPLL